jgi:hypothetical protein
VLCAVLLPIVFVGCHLVSPFHRRLHCRFDVWYYALTRNQCQVIISNKIIRIRAACECGRNLVFFFRTPPTGAAFGAPPPKKSLLTHENQPREDDCNLMVQSLTIPIEQYRLLIQQVKSETEAARRSTLATLRNQDRVIQSCNALLEKHK